MNVRHYKAEDSILFEPTDKIAIVISDFYTQISSLLLQGTIETLLSYSVPNIEVLYVSGTYEIPMLCKFLVDNKEDDLLGIVTLGVVIKGETRHNQHIEEVSFRKISDIAINFSIPITLGILTTDNEKQAMQRTGNPYNNKGSEASKALLQLLSVMKQKKNNSNP